MQFQLFSDAFQMMTDQEDQELELLSKNITEFVDRSAQKRGRKIATDIIQNVQQTNEQRFSDVKFQMMIDQELLPQNVTAFVDRSAQKWGRKIATDIMDSLLQLHKACCSNPMIDDNSQVTWQQFIDTVYGDKPAWVSSITWPTSDEAHSSLTGVFMTNSVVDAMQELGGWTGARDVVQVSRDKWAVAVRFDVCDVADE